MSVINSTPNPMNPSETLNFAKGSIKFISIKPVKPGPNVVDGVKTTWIKIPGQQDKKIEATHSISFLLQEVDDKNNIIDPNSKGEWIGMGEKKLNPNYADKVQVKVGDAWKDILNGMVISVPLKISKNGDKTYVNASLAKLNILDESRASAAQPQRQQQQGGGQQSSGGNAGGGTKIFGTVLEINGNSVKVDDENIGPGVIILSDEQVAKVTVGGRVGGNVNTADGTLISGFRVYGPAGAGGGKSGGGGKRGSYDAVGVSTGHAMNVVSNLVSCGWKGNYLEAGKISHDVTTRLIKEYSAKSGKDEGQSVGNAVKFAAADLAINNRELTAELLEENARMAYEQLAAGLREFIEGYGKADGNSATQGVTEPLANNTPAPTNTPPDPGTFDDPMGMDFDDDIPF